MFNLKQIRIIFVNAFEFANRYECVIKAPDSQNLRNGLYKQIHGGYLHLVKGTDYGTLSIIRNKKSAYEDNYALNSKHSTSFSVNIKK